MSKVEELKSKIEKKDVSGKDIMLFLEAIQEISQDSEDIQDLLEDMKEEEEVIHLNLILTDLNNLTASLSIVDGVISIANEKSEPSTLDIITVEETAIKILCAELGIGKAYSEGLIQAKGNFTKVLGLAIILEKVSEELNIA